MKFFKKTVSFITSMALTFLSVPYTPFISAENSASAVSVNKGDINKNGNCDAFDMTLLQNMILMKRNIKEADLKNSDYNEDSKVNIFDLMHMNNDLKKNNSELTCIGKDSGDGWTYDNGVLTVLNTDGSISTDSGWKQYKNLIWSLNIKNGAESINRYAFTDMPMLKQITFPASLKNISECAFKGCSDLLAVTLPEGLKNIENNAFEGCISLGNICLPSSVEQISDNAFPDSKQIQIFGNSEYVESYCNKNNIVYIPYCIDSMDDACNSTEVQDLQYTEFDNWHLKEWFDEDGKVKNTDGKLQLTANGSYITAFCDDTVEAAYFGNDIRIVIEAESTDRDLLDHIYAGYVIPEPFNDLEYPLGKVISCTQENDVYKAKIEVHSSFETDKSVLFQIRLGCNVDSVNGSVLINSYTIFSSCYYNYSSFDDSNWKLKKWEDSDGDVVFKDGEMILSADDSYVTAYSNKIISNKNDELLPLMTEVVVQTDNEELLNHIYLGRVEIKDNKEKDINYELASIESKKKTGDVYEAVITGENFCLSTDYFLQIRLGKNIDHVSGTITVKNIKLRFEEDYAKVSLGTGNESYGITQFIRKTYPQQNFNINEPCDRSYVISALAMLYRYREGLEEISGPFTKDNRIYIILKRKDGKNGQKKYEEVTGISTASGKTDINLYYFDAAKSYIDRIRKQGIGFGEYYLLSQSHTNKRYYNYFNHNKNGGESNFKRFIAGEINEYFGKLPIIDDDGKTLYADLKYISKDKNKDYRILSNENIMDTYYVFKDISQGYIHDLSYLSYKQIYNYFESEHEGKGKFIFNEFFKGCENIGYSDEGFDAMSDISMTLTDVLIPGFSDYHDYLSLHINAQSYLSCINALIFEAKNYDSKFENSSETTDLYDFLSSNEEIALTVRKMLYFAEIEGIYGDESYLYLSDIMKNKDLHVFCSDQNFDGKADEEDT